MPDDPAERGARANVHPSTLRDMTNIGYDARADLGAYRFSHSPCGMIPQDFSREAINPPGNGTGWTQSTPFVRDDLVKAGIDQHPTPGVLACDRLIDAQDKIDRAELEARFAAQRAMETKP